MPPRPLHRWKSLWLGVFVLVFLGWSWIRSSRFVDLVEFESGLHAPRIALGHGDGTIGFVWDVHAGDNGFQVRTLPARSDRWFAVPLAVDGTASGNRYLTFAHWFIILLFLTPWTAFLTWRVRRMKAKEHRTSNAQHRTPK